MVVESKLSTECTALIIFLYLVVFSVRKTSPADFLSFNYDITNHEVVLVPFQVFIYCIPL